MCLYDLIVCGAGCAGFCASVAAARQGLKVALVERYNTPGGILTVLGNNSIDQFNNPYKKDKKMIIKGIGWEFVQRLKKDNFAKIPNQDAEYRNHAQYGVKVNPVAAAKVMDDMLIESGVKLFYGQPVVDAETDGNIIVGIKIATKTGLKELKAKLFIDCTGDGELGCFAGAEFIAGDGEGNFQPGTLRFYPAVDAKDSILNYGDNQNHFTIDITDSESVSNAEIESRKKMYEQMKQGSKVMSTAPAIAPREGRRIMGITQMNSEDYCNGTIFEDSVCYSYWFIDIHKNDEPTYIKYIRHDKTPTIRLSSMISKDFENLMMAGRCVSSDRETNSSLRVKASCMAMGEAVGVAAAISILGNVKVKDVCIKEMKEMLSKQGAIVPGISCGEEFI